MKNWKSLVLTVAVLALTWTEHAAHGQSPPPQTNSAKSSPSSDTDATSKQSAVGSRQIAACMATAVELEKTRVMVASLESETRAITERLETEKSAVAILIELNEARQSETDALRSTLAAKNETITAKVAVIASQDRLIIALKTKKPSPWRRIGDILIGAAAFAILK